MAGFGVFLLLFFFNGEPPTPSNFLSFLASLFELGGRSPDMLNYHHPQPAVAAALTEDDEHCSPSYPKERPVWRRLRACPPQKAKERDRGEAFFFGPGRKEEEGRLTRAGPLSLPRVRLGRLHPREGQRRSGLLQ